MFRNLYDGLAEAHAVAVGGLAEQVPPDGTGRDVRRGSTVDLREFLRHSVDPVDSEASVFQELFSFGVGKRTLQYRQRPLVNAILAEMPERLNDKGRLAITARQRLRPGMFELDGAPSERNFLARPV